VTNPSAPIGELDLLAYADGHLDHDVVRKRQVEAYLADHPLERERLRDIAAQNEALRQAGQAWIQADVPTRLLETINRTRPPLLTRRRAAMAISLSLATALGWAAGNYDPRREIAPIDPFVQQAVAHHNAVQVEGVGRTAAASSHLAPLALLNNRLTFEIGAPDLTDQGFDLIGWHELRDDGRLGVQLLYEGRDGALVSLSMRPRWTEGGADVLEHRETGLVAYQWAEGPLSLILATPDEASELVERVRSKIGRKPASLKPGIQQEAQAVDLPARGPSPGAAPVSVQQ